MSPGPQDIDITTTFDRYAALYGTPLHLPPPDPRDMDHHVLPVPFFELNAATHLFDGKKNPAGIEWRPFAGVINGAVPNAQADFFDGVHLAVFGFAFCIELYCYFQVLLSHPGVFQGVGDAEKESVRIAWNNDPHGFPLRYFGGLQQGEMFGPLPRDPQRRMMGIRLYHWAMRFIGYHEIAHLALGHVHFVQDECGICRIDDNAQAYQSSEYTRIRRALEQQADLHAMQRLATTAMLDSKRPGAPPDDLAVQVFEMMYAVTTVMRLWSRGHTFSRGGTVETYPHPAVRYAGLTEAVRARFQELGMPEQDQKAWTMGVGISWTEAALGDAALGCEESFISWVDDWEGLLAAFREVNEDFRSAKVKDHLSQYAFAEYYDASNILG
jgi:hypothetical protein